MLLPYIAASLLVGIGIAHSWLGERYVLRRIARLEELPRLVLGGREVMREVLRFAWHITSIAWFGLAGILVLMAHGKLTNASASAVIAGTFLFSGLIALVGGRGKHYSWVIFLAVAVIAFYGAAT